MYYYVRLLSISILLGLSPVCSFLLQRDFCYDYSTIGLLILLFMDSRAGSNFLLLRITLLWTFLYCSLDPATHPQAVSISPYKTDSPGFMWRTMYFWPPNTFKFQTLLGLNKFSVVLFFFIDIRPQMEILKKGSNDLRHILKCQCTVYFK